MDIIISLEPVGSKKIVDFWNCSELIKGTKKQKDGSLTTDEMLFSAPVI